MSILLCDSCLQYANHACSEHGLATHYIPSRRVPLLLQRLAELNDPTPSLINSTIEELSSESSEDETRTTLIGTKRAAIDTVFRHNEVETIIVELERLTGHEDESIKTWASTTLQQLNDRSPTSLKVSLQAIRKGKKLQLREALNLELNIATAFCVRFFRFVYAIIMLISWNILGRGHF